MSVLIALFMGAGLAPLPDNSSMLPKHQVRYLVSQFGDCIVRREPRLSSEAILRGQESGGLMSQFPRLVQEGCVPMYGAERVEVTFTGNQYRYAIAEALVRRELAAVPAPEFDDVPALAHGPEMREPTVDGSGKPLTGNKLKTAMQRYAGWRTSNYMWRFGECVARVDAAAARKLLLTIPETADENASFGALTTALGTCLGEGRQIKLGKADVRGTIAVNYYRLAHAAARTGPK